MNPRTAALLALVAALLGGFIYFYELEGESARQSALDDEKRIHSGLSADQIDVIEFVTEDGIEARFERREGRWHVNSPIQDRADTTALDAIAHALTDLPREGVVADPGNAEQYGLGDAARTVRFETAGASKGLRIGSPTPVGGHVYVARPERDEVAFVERYRLNALNKSLDDLRDRRLFEFDAGDVRTLRLSWHGVGGSTQVALARDASDEWQMGVPVMGRADQQIVRDLVSDLAFLNAKQFVDEATDATDEALAEPVMTVFWTLSGDHVERRVRIGGEFGEGRLVEAPDGRLRTIEAARIDDFKRTVNDYRFKTLSEFDLADARRLLLNFVDAAGVPLSIEAVLSGAGWTGSKPRIDPTRAADLVRALASLRAVDIVADEMGPNELASLGLSPPRAKIRIEDREEPGEATRVLAEVAIGRRDADRGFFAQRGGDATVFVLEASIADEIPNSSAAFAEIFEADDEDPTFDNSGTADPRDVEVDDPSVDLDPLDGVQIP